LGKEISLIFTHVSVYGMEKSIEYYDQQIYLKK